MLFSVVRLETLRLSRPVSIKIEPPGRVGLLRRCHASEKKSLTLKITVELICHLHPDILQDPGDYLLHVLVHSHRH